MQFLLKPSGLRIPKANRLIGAGGSHCVAGGIKRQAENFVGMSDECAGLNILGKKAWRTPQRYPSQRKDDKEKAC